MVRHVSETHRRRWGRNLALLLALVGLLALFYVLTIVRITGGG